MSRRLIAAGLGTFALSAVIVLAHQIYRASHQLGSLFAAASSGAARQPRAALPADRPAHDTTRYPAHETTADSPAGDTALSLPAELAAELPPSFDDELVLRAAIEQSLSDPDPDVRAEAAAALDALLDEDSVRSQHSSDEP